MAVANLLEAGAAAETTGAERAGPAGAMKVCGRGAFKSPDAGGAAGLKSRWAAARERRSACVESARITAFRAARKRPLKGIPSRTAFEAVSPRG